MDKVCRDCRESKPLHAFYRQEECRQGVRPECKRCTVARRTARYQQNRSRERAYSAQYQQEHREAFRRYNRAYYQRHRDEIRRKGIGWWANWVERNPEKYRANARKQASVRRARKAETSVEPVDYAAIIERHGMVCYLCLEEIALAVLEFDHVVPLSRGGTHTEDNIRPSHRRCNRRKYNKLLSELPALRPTRSRTATSQPICGSPRRSAPGERCARSAWPMAAP